MSCCMLIQSGRGPWLKSARLRDHISERVTVLGLYRTICVGHKMVIINAKARHESSIRATIEIRKAAAIALSNALRIVSTISSCRI